MPHNLWTAWNLELSILIPLEISVLVYIWGTGRVWQRAGLGHGITWRGLIGFVGGMLALVVALVSPLDEVSGELFSAHMAQHLILILIAAPLLILSDLPVALLWALPRRSANALARRLNQSQTFSRLWQAVDNPIFAWVLFALALWGWHAPAFYQAALRDATIHAVEHLVLLVSAMLFWRVLFKRSTPAYIRHGMAIPYLFTTALQSGALGALMTFTSQPWYPYYVTRVTPWGLTPLEDQQLAGVLMWIPGGLVFTLLTIAYFAAWFSALEQRSVQLER